MYEYRFVRCHARFAGAGGVETESYRSEIDAHASQGWRLVQVLVQHPAAVLREYELIFERPKPT